MKMRKMMAMILSTAMVLGSGQMVLAESALNFDGITESKEAEAEEKDIVDEKNSENAEKGVFDTASTDVISIENGTYTVTSEFSTVTFTPSFGWICLTQDVGQQFSEFSQVFSDPMSVVNSMIDSGDHFLLTDTGLTVLIEHRQNQDAYSNIIQNSTNMTASDDETIINALLESSFPGYTSATLDAGGHHFVCFLSPDGMDAFYETVVDGVNYDFFVDSWADDGSALTQQTLTEFEAMLGTLTIG